MKILAIIPARAGSKRIPHKNKRLLGEKPLIVWSIDSVKGISVIGDILVSTDDSEIADIAQHAGTLVPWLRPAELATDHADSVSVVLHALNLYEHVNGEVEGVLLLQPTSPFRSRNTVINGIQLFTDGGGRTVIAVSPAASHPLWCFKVENNKMEPFVTGSGVTMRSQDLPPAFVVNGALYLIAPHVLRQTSSFYENNIVPLVMNDPYEGLDIDTELDWQLANTYLHHRAVQESAC